jgi:hypothetical protein
MGISTTKKQDTFEVLPILKVYVSNVQRIRLIALRARFALTCARQVCAFLIDDTKPLFFILGVFFIIRRHSR